MEDPAPTKSNKAPLMLVAVFVSLIFLPMLDSAFNIDRTDSVNENRTLSKFPVFQRGPGEIRSFAVGVESYYNDHFGFRKWLIHAAHNWKRQWFRESMQSGVVIGRNGWLYNSESVGQTADGGRITAAFTSAELQDWQSVFESRQALLKRRSIHYLVIIPPEKHSVYPEYLPGWLRNPNSSAKIDQFIAHMKSHTTVEFLDLRPALLHGKKFGLLYCLTDTHWNQLGAFIACNEIIGALSRDIPRLTPLSLDSFNMTFTNLSGCNLARMLTSEDSLIERNSPMLIPREPLPVLQVKSSGTKGAIIDQVTNPAKTGGALFFCDSYATALLPFLGYNFKSVSLYRLYDGGLAVNCRNEPVRAHIWALHIVEEQKPEVVIDEILESLLLLEDPAEVKRQNILE